jgi:hypothetical protein
LAGLSHHFLLKVRIASNSIESQTGHMKEEEVGAAEEVGAVDPHIMDLSAS